MADVADGGVDRQACIGGIDRLHPEQGQAQHTDGGVLLDAFKFRLVFDLFRHRALSGRGDLRNCD